MGELSLILRFHMRSSICLRFLFLKLLIERRRLGAAHRFEGRTHLSTEKVRLLPGREVPAFIELVVIDELRIRPLGPTPRRLIALARKDAHGSRRCV